MIVVDIETTGLEPEKCGIASIGALDFSNSQNQFYLECRVPENALVSDDALKVNGFTREQLFDVQKSDIRNSIEKFFNWALRDIGDITLGGENIGFDISFLKAYARALSIPWIFGYRSRDLHTTSIDVYEQNCVKFPMKNKVSALSLDETLKFVGLLEEPKPHNALTGAKMEAEAFSRLIFGKNLLLEYSQFKIPDYLMRKQT